ncbi:hypothetical protein HUJ05_009600 [Dendroctonus ponderosae]|nr:hypothetical protein HUJ05_005181 [Dendroctonus ponderosae]KAH1002030.1 hypothetical protein HUJ05_009600 [Dendroctonus ponderosae]
MNIKNSPGPGNINIELLQAAPNVILNILAVIFNQCIEGLSNNLQNLRNRMHSRQDDLVWMVFSQ